ncbi:MAG TPA: guanylate kinase [Bacteroidales bacterium]|nr:guanylate kinase [Bacteroidales bacterium]
MEGRLLIFSAPSGSGKTTIVKDLLQRLAGLEFSVSACSRARREGETDGKDYYFLSAQEFRKKIEEGEFVEWEEVYPDQYYGTLKSELKRIWDKGHHVVFDVDVVGGLNLKKKFGHRALAIFIKAPSLEELEKRLRARSTDDESSIRKRIDKASYEMKYAPEFDRTIVNDNLETACEEAEKAVRDFLAT